MKLGHRRMPLSLTAVVLSGLVLFSCSASASVIGHGESKLLNLPLSTRGEHAHHGIHGHQHKARLYHRRTEGVLVEVPYTIWTGTFADLIKRSPGASPDSDDDHDGSDNHVESKGKHDKEVCLGVTCQKGYYCTDAGCCPEGSECTGISTCLDAKDPACPKDIACCPKANPVCKITGGQGFCVQDNKDQEAETTSKAPAPTPSAGKENPTDIKSKQQTTSIGGNGSTKTTAILTQTSTAVILPTAIIVPTAVTLPTPPVGLPTLPPAPTPVDNPTGVSAAPTPSTTGVVHEMSDGAKIAAGVIAGSIVFIAFGSMILYAIVKKRRERPPVVGFEEEIKTEPMSGMGRAAPMGVGGASGRLSIQPEPETLHLADRSAEAGNNVGAEIPPVPTVPVALQVGR